MRNVMIKHKEYYPKGCWVYLACEEEKPFVDDERIYHYLDTKEEILSIKKGDTITLDEDFKVVDIEDWEEIGVTHRKRCCGKDMIHDYIEKDLEFGDEEKINAYVCPMCGKILEIISSVMPLDRRWKLQQKIKREELQ
jgi:hypothetical protein